MQAERETAPVWFNSLTEKAGHVFSWSWI